MRVLVANASKHGSTRGIADRIGEDLRAEYDAFVVGSGAYAGH